MRDRTVEGDFTVLNVIKKGASISAGSLSQSITVGSVLGGSSSLPSMMHPVRQSVPAADSMPLSVTSLA